MPDIRLARRETSHIWVWTGILAALGLVLWGASFIFGDPTDPMQPPRVGAAADFGAERTPVLPIEAVPLETLIPLDPRDLGRLVRLRGTVESRMVRGNVWVRSVDGRRILARVEPAPLSEVPALRPAASIDIEGHLHNISRTEFFAWMDSLNVSIPRPPAPARFGQVPGPEFTRALAQYVREYYVSIPPEHLTEP
jgi:hypothetical protein